MRKTIRPPCLRAKAKSNFAPEVLRDFISAGSPGYKAKSVSAAKGSPMNRPPPLTTGLSFGEESMAVGEASYTARSIQALQVQLKAMNLSLHQIKRQLETKPHLKTRATPGKGNNLYEV